MGDLFSLDITAHVGILAGSSWVVVVGGLSGVDFFPLGIYFQFSNILCHARTKSASHLNAVSSKE